MTELERRIERHAGLERAGRRFMDYLNYGENVRTAEIPFEEPAPGCKYNVTRAKGFVVIPLNERDLSEFLLKIREYLMEISYQLFDGTGRKISLNVVTVSNWERLIEEPDGRISTSIEIHTHNTKFRTFISRNQIPTKCDELIFMLHDKMMMPAGISGLSFKSGILVRVEYYANMSSEKKNKKGKYKGGKWVDHMTIPCFTRKVRTDDFKAMDNYTVNKSSYIYNIKNTDDDLCFISI